MQAILIQLKKNWHFFMKNIKVPSLAHGHDGHGVNREKKGGTVKRERNISYTSGVAAIKPGINRNFG